MNILQRTLWLLFFYSFAFLNWTIHILLSFRTGVVSFIAAPSRKELSEFNNARDKFWNLTKDPIPGFKHAFYKLQDGLKLHYVSSSASNAGNLVILLHGFPDSYTLWRHALYQTELSEANSKIVMLDLPNFGGSDTLAKPDSCVVDAVAEFVLGMKTEHAKAIRNSEFKTIIIAHDWGAIIGFKLAADETALADRFILCNGGHMALALYNKDGLLRDTAQLWHHFCQAPYKNFDSLAGILHSLRPILLQTVLYGYIFAFYLPKFLVTFLGTVGNHAFLRGVLRNPHLGDPTEWDAQECLAASFGPGPSEILTANNKDSYGKSVGLRSRSASESFWQQTAYYRHGLGTTPWKKSAAMLEMNVDAKCSTKSHDRSNSMSISGIGKDNLCLKWPTTIVWGMNDIVLREEIYLNGLDRCLGEKSELILLPRSGHWVPLEPEGCLVFGHLIETCARPNVQMYFGKSVQSLYPGALIHAKS